MNILSKIIYYLLKLPNRQKLNKYSQTIKFGDFCSFSFYPKSKITLGNNINLKNSCNIFVKNNANLTIGDNTFFNNNCSINCLESIEIGENTLFGENVKLYDHNHQYSSNGVEHQKFNTAPIKIGKNCWIGSNVIVLKGVTIGDNVILGAGCVIHKDVPANSIIINKQEHIIKKDTK